MPKKRQKQQGAAVQTKKQRKVPLDQITHCHPSKSETQSKRCLPSSVYNQVAKNINAAPTDNLFQKVGCQEGEDHCLLDKIHMDDKEKKQLRKEYLRPKRPNEWVAKPNTWLDNFNIKEVMDQYQEAKPWFKFLGVFPIDFSVPDPYLKGETKQCLYKETCNLNLKEEYSKGIRGLGMIFNLDEHYKGGSHWVGLYIDLHTIKKPFVGYFDSYGYKVPAMIARLMRALKLQIKTCALGYNARRFQQGGSECGMFSLYFIICMIHGISFKDFCKDSVNDAYMLQLRQVIFSR
jgi:hypothetical protein